METLAISSIVGIVLFSIGVFIGKSSPCHHDIYHDFCDTRLGKLGSLETKIFILEKENERLNFLYESLTRDKRLFQEYMAFHCGNCDKIFCSNAGETPKHVPKSKK